MTFNDYQEFTGETAIYPNAGNNITYPTLGLCGEAGEVAEKVKKIFRDKAGIPDENDRMLIKKECGDVLWYLARLAAEFKFSLDEVAYDNIVKLTDRKNRGVLGGSGDLR